MKGTIADLIGLAATTPELARKLEALAAEYDLELALGPDALTDEELDALAGGGTVKVTMASLTGGGLPDGISNPVSSPSPTPTPYPNVSGTGTGDVKTRFIDGGGDVEVSQGDEPGSGDG